MTLSQWIHVTAQSILAATYWVPKESFTCMVPPETTKRSRMAAYRCAASSALASLWCSCTAVATLPISAGSPAYLATSNGTCAQSLAPYTPR